MKQTLLIITALMLIVGCSKEPINYETTLVVREGVFYTKETNKPYSGPVFSLNENGRNKRESILEDGKMIIYKDIEWYSNRQKKSEETYKNGKLDGFSTSWDKNNIKLYSIWYVSGERNFSKDEFYKKDASLKEPINYEETLNERDGVFYTKDTNKPYSGQVFSLYWDGKKSGEGTLKDGEKDGKWTWWYENGQKKREGTYKSDDGFRPFKDGLWTEWHENGQKRRETTYKDGGLDGLNTTWYENGQKGSEQTYKKNEPDGLHIEWYENGQKEWEGTYKKNEPDGLHTEWYENGQKKRELIIKYGNLISVKQWNEDGSVKE